MTDQSPPSSDEDLVFICGALRSGTTLLRLMVNAHPALSNPGEMDFLFEPPPMLDGRRDMAQYYHELSHNRVFNARGLKIDATLDFDDQVRDFIRQLRTRGKRVSINIHRNFDRIPAIFPKARYVHLLRDPRDVANSSIGMGWAGNVYHGVEHWIASEKAFARLAAMQPKPEILEMRNEELIKNPAAELTRLCRFIGADFDPAMLEYPEDSTYSAPDPRLVEQWRRNMSKRDVALVEGRIGAMLAQRGYAPSGEAPITPGIFERFWLKQQNRAGRIADSVKRNGLGLAALEILSRPLPFSGLKEHVRKRIGQKALKYLK